MAGNDSLPRRIAKKLYHQAVDAAYGGKGLPIDLNSGHYRVDPRYRSGFRDPYEADVADFLRARAKPGGVCFDVGANVGIYVLQFSTWIGREGRIVAFEPNPESFAALAIHVRLNDLERRVTLVNAAVSDAPGKLTMYCSDFDGRSRLAAPNELVKDFAKEVEVPVVTIDDIADSSGLTPDMVLFDVEGFEHLALKGAQRCLERGRGRTVIAVEMHPTMWDTSDTSAPEFRAWMDDFGVTPVRITEEKDPFVDGGVVHLAWR